MSQEQKQQQQKGDPILEGQELGIQRGKKEDVSLHISFEGDDSLIEDTERMSRKLSGERDEVVRGDVREGVETRLHTTTTEPRYNVMSTTASGAADLPDTKLGGDVKHLGESVLHHKTKTAGKETPLEPSVLDPGFTGMTANKSSSNQ